MASLCGRGGKPDSASESLFPRTRVAGGKPSSRVPLSAAQLHDRPCRFIAVAGDYERLDSLPGIAANKTCGRITEKICSANSARYLLWRDLFCCSSPY